MASLTHWTSNLSNLQETVKDKEAQHAAVYGVAKSRTRLSDWTTIIPKYISPHGSPKSLWLSTFSSSQNHQEGLFKQLLLLLCPWDFPGKNTWMGCHFLLQGIFPTQELNLCLLRLPAMAGGFFTTEPPEESKTACWLNKIQGYSEQHRKHSQYSKTVNGYTF